MNQRDAKLQNKNSQLLEEARRRQKERALLSEAKPAQKNWDGWEEQESLYQLKPSKVSLHADRQDLYQPFNQNDRSDRLSKVEDRESLNPSILYNNPDRIEKAERFTQGKSENYLQKTEHTSSSLLSSQPAEDFKQFIDREYLQLKTELENLRKCSKPVQSTAFVVEKQSKTNSSHSALPERVEKRAGIKQESIAPAFIGKFNKAEKPTGNKKQPFIEVVFKEKPTREKEDSASPQAQNLRSVKEVDRPSSALVKKSQPLKVESCSIDIVPEGRKSPAPQTKRSVDGERERDKKVLEFEKVVSAGLQKGNSGRAASVNNAEKYQDSRPQRAPWPDCPQPSYGWDNRFPVYQNYGYPYYQFPQVHSVPHMPQMQQIPPMQPMHPMNPMQPMGHMQGFPSGPYPGVNFMQPYYNPSGYGGYMPSPYNQPQFTAGYPPGPQGYMSNPANNDFYAENNFGSRNSNSNAPEVNDHQNENYEFSNSEHSNHSPSNHSNLSDHEETINILKEDKIETFDFEVSEPSSNFVVSKKRSEDFKVSNSRKSLDEKFNQHKLQTKHLEDPTPGNSQSADPSDPSDLSDPSSKKAILIEVGVNNKKSLAEIFKEKNKKAVNRIHNREDHISKLDHREKTKEELIEIRKNMVKQVKHEVKPNLIEVKLEEKKNSKEPSSQLMERLATGSRVKITKEEMLKLNKKNYKLLPEVKKKQEEEKKRLEKQQRIMKAKEYEKVFSSQVRQDERKFKVLIDN